MNFIAISCTCWDIRISRYKVAILDFALPVSLRLVVQHCHYFHWIAGHQNHRYSTWKFVAFSCASWDISISSLGTAILDFKLPVSPRFVVRHCHYFRRIAGPQKHRYSCWNFVAIFCTSGDEFTSSLEAAILDFPLPVAFGSFTVFPLDGWTPKTQVLPLEFLWYLVYKVRFTYFKFTCRHLGFYTTCFFPFGRTTLTLFPLDSWIPKT